MHHSVVDIIGPSEDLEGTKTRPNLLLGSTLCTTQLSIDLGDAKESYTNLEHVRGHVQYSADFEHSEHYLTISLLGISHVNMDVWHPSATAYRSTLSQWVFLRQETSIGLHRATRQADFDFELPRTLQPHQCPLGCADHLALPPTLGMCDFPDKRYDLTAFGSSARIVYQIRVELKRTCDNSHVGHAAKPFLFVPHSGAVLRPRQLQEQTTTYNNKVRNSLGRTLGSIQVSVSDEIALNTSGTGEPRTSPLPLCLTYTGRRPPILTRVDVQLVARTVRRVTHNHDETKPESSSMICKAVQAINLSDSVPLTWRQSNTQLQLWHLDLSLPVSMGGCGVIAVMPSFESCLLARRYRLRLSLSLAASSGYSLGFRPLELEVPVSIEQRISSSRSLSLHPSYFKAQDTPEEQRPTYWDAAYSRAEIAPVVSVPRYTDPVQMDEQDRRPSWQDKDSSSRSTSSSGFLRRSPDCEEI